MRSKIVFFVLFRLLFCFDTIFFLQIISEKVKKKKNLQIAKFNLPQSNFQSFLSIDLVSVVQPSIDFNFPPVPDAIRFFCFFFESQLDSN